MEKTGYKVEVRLWVAQSPNELLTLEAAESLRQELIMEHGAKPSDVRIRDPRGTILPWR